MSEHRDTGFRCLVAHYDKDGYLKPPCRQCSCGEWVKHEDCATHFKPRPGAPEET